MSWRPIGAHVRRRAQSLGAQGCFEYARTAQGLCSLSNPLTVRKSSKDPNRGLYPRVRKKFHKVYSENGQYRRTMSVEKPDGWFDDDEDSLLVMLSNSCSPSPSSCQVTPRTPVSGSERSPGSCSSRGSSTSANHFRSSLSVRKVLQFPSTESSGVQPNNPAHLNGPSTSSSVQKPQTKASSSSSDCSEFKPWLLERRKRKFDEYGIDQGPERDDISRTPKKRKQPATPQKNTLLNYFGSPLKSPSKPKAEGTTDDVVIVPFIKKVEQVDLTSSPCKVSVMEKLVPSPQPSSSKSTTRDQTEDDDSDATYVSDSELQALQKEQAMETGEDVESKELNDIYGLLGSGLRWEWDGETEERIELRQFDKLPPEIVENIFCQLPLQQLCLTLSLVNKRWNDIISNKRFLQWKKKYYKLKHNIVDAESNMISFCIENRMDTCEDCLINLIRYIKTFKILKACEVENVLSCLQWHSKYQWAKDLLQERLPDCFINTEHPNPWSMITALCLLSHSVQDVSRIFDCLTHGKSTLLLHDVMELMYCLATCFMHFRNKYSISPGFHYRVYYALHLFENKGTVQLKDLIAIRSSTSGQQSVRRYVDNDHVIRLTHEQLRIVNHPLQPRDVVKIVAFAGTGKTTTLVEFTKMWPSKRFLSIVYNKAARENAERMFPLNVKCQTVHSVAYQVVGKWFRSRLGFRLNAFDFVSFIEGDNKLMRAATALKTISAFISSVDELITIAHVPDIWVNRRGERETFTENRKLQLCDDAICIWKEMKNVKSRVNITHDVYLKLYQLEKLPIEGYDCILLDEAQDYSPAMLDVFTIQQCPKIIVGDPHQQMYAFRGAINSMDSINATHTYYLTQSFRFGPEIAYVASCALETMMKETRKTIVGTSKPGSYAGESKGQVAIIARTNFTLFAEAVRVCCEENQPIRGAFIGGIANYALDQLLDIYNLMVAPSTGIPRESVQIKNKFINRFQSFEKLTSYANTVDDIELQGKIKIVTTYNYALPSHVEKIKQRCSYDVQLADVVFSTAHKAKGREFDTVKLAGDFLVNCFSYDEQDTYRYVVNQEATNDEANIFYVAISRAKRCLILSSVAAKLLLVSGERFEDPWAKTSLDLEQLELEGETFRCITCGQRKSLNEQKAIVLKRRRVDLSCGDRIDGGLLCYVCAHAPYYTQFQFTVEPMLGPLCHDSNHQALSRLVGPLGDVETVQANEMVAMLMPA